MLMRNCVIAWCFCILQVGYRCHRRALALVLQQSQGMKQLMPRNTRMKSPMAKIYAFLKALASLFFACYSLLLPLRL